MTARDRARTSPADAAILAAALLVPVPLAALIGAGVRAAWGLYSHRMPRGLILATAGGAAMATAAALTYQVVAGVLPDPLGRGASFLAASLSTAVFVAFAVGERVLHDALLARVAWRTSLGRALGGSARPPLLWLFGLVTAIEIARIEPLVLIPAVPLLALGYREVVAHFTAARRLTLLGTAVDLWHAVGTTLDQVEVFRAIYRQVQLVMPVDAFFVAIADASRTKLSYRFLVDENRELEPQERAFAGTLAGYCVEHGEPLLLRDAARDREAMGLPRVAWGTVVEHSIVVAPLRVRGDVIGSISAQSVQLDAYDPDDLELIENIANEAALAIERAELHEGTARLSRRLFDLHRFGAELVTQRDTASLSRRLSAAIEELLGAHCLVYLDAGGDTLARADLDEKGDGAAASPRTIEKRGTFIERALETGAPVEIADVSQLPDTSRRYVANGASAILIQPLRAAAEAIGVLYVAWDRKHTITAEERDLVGVIAGIGAAALRSLRLYDELEDAYLSTVSTLTATTAAREGYREGHLRRVAADAVALGQRIGLPNDALRALRYAALFHSIGKIAIPARILGKAGPLDEDERRAVQEHPVLGAQIVGSIGFLRDVAPVVRHANERWDGSGYPDRLAGEAIPRLARVLAVAVGYNAMRVERPYRPALSVEGALRELRANAGICYDPVLAEEFALMTEAQGAIAQAEQELVGARELAILAELTPEFHSLLDLQQLLDRVLRLLRERMRSTRVAIFLEDTATGDLVLRASAGEWSASGMRRLPKGRGVAGWVLSHGKAQVVEDVLQDARWLPTGDETRSALVVPLLTGGRAIGVLALLHSAVGAFGQRDLTLLQAVGAQLAAAIEVAGLHERLKHAANTDALTGIHNHRYFWDRLGEEVSRAERRDAPLSIAYLDIDGLKRVNDDHGHLAGDAVLRKLGELIGANVRQEDVPARYGGDEFAVIMPETPREEAEKAVSRLMELIDAARVDLGDGRAISMPTRSWGVASFPSDARSPKELVERADSRAYAVKRASR